MILWTLPSAHLMIFSYSLSLPLLSFHLLYMTLASTLAGLGEEIINYRKCRLMILTDQNLGLLDTVPGGVGLVEETHNAQQNGPHILKVTD